MADNSGEGARRSAPARIGLVLLNLLLPGLGLVRIGRWRTGLLLMVAPFLSLLIAIGLAAVSPRLAPGGFLAFIAWSAFLTIGVYGAAIVLTWMWSRVRAGPAPWWSRWYALIAVLALSQLALSGVVALGHSLYKPYYLPAESMHPTLMVGDRFVADMRDRGVPKRGEIILLRVGDAIYVKRVAAIAGDRIAMRAGVPVVNGSPAVQRKIADITISEFSESVPATVLTEQFPGEGGRHRVLDMGTSTLDEMAETVIPPERLFVLGDNRDRSADSRVSRADRGVEIPMVADIAGRPVFKTWDAEWDWLGEPIEQQILRSP